jgi:hypothetical protein
MLDEADRAHKLQLAALYVRDALHGRPVQVPSAP